jgi:5-methylcytosine-specific restriction endonuclease McrA
MKVKTRERKARERATAWGVTVRPINRWAIIKRDDSTCYLCHRKIGKRECVLDHVIPLSRGGEHSESNLRVACPPCNLRKGNRLPEECEWLKP